LLFSCLLFAQAQSRNVYVDSQQRFTIRVPAGWVAKPFNTGGVSGVTIAHGESAYVQIFLQKGIDPASFLKALNNGIQTSHPGYRVSDRGLRDVAGESRMYIVGESAETPTVPRTRVYLETFSANGYSYAIIASSSGKIAAGKDMPDYDVSQQMIQSLTVKGVAASPTKTANAPAPAKAPPPSLPPAPVPVIAATPASGNPGMDLPSEDQKKLAALDAALKDGVLSNEEYQAKKSALYAAAHPQPDNTARLKALDQALADGVLNQDEYDRKKRELNGEPVPVAPSNTAAPSPAPPNSAAPTAALTPPVTLSAAPLAPEPARNANPEPETPPLSATDVVIAKSEPAPTSEPLPKSWTTDMDPAGFRVDLPSIWNVSKVRATGQIVVRGMHGEEVMIWPLRLKQPELDARGASSLIQELARKFDVLMPWGSVQTAHNSARVIGLGAQRSAAAVLSWANNPSGASVYFYAAEAPGDLYSQSVDSFAAVMKSFQVVQDPSLKSLPAGASGSANTKMSFVKWSDPHEGAFTVSVPQGWQVIGGTYRLSTEDVRYGVVLESPDGQVRASIGDSVVGAFTQPTQALAATGLREGGYQTLTDGTRVEVLRYLSGQQFARSYVETLVSRQCSKPQIVSNNTREDMAANFGQSAANEGFVDALLTAGDVSFTCNLDGRPVKGKLIAATIRMAPNVSPLWFVYRLFGYIASTGREQDGENVLMQMIQSWRLSPEWQAAQKDAAAPAVQPDNARTQEIRERAQEAIVEDQRQISDMIARSSVQRQRAYDQIDRKLQSSILGTFDVVDPDTGTQYRLNNFSDYHYLSNEGYLYSANSADASGSSLREMISLP
jgi:hypothetical protein